MKKVLSFLIILTICISLLSVVVHAETVSFYLETDKSDYVAGDTIQVTIRVSENSELIGGEFEILYDDTKVKYLSTYTNGNTGMNAFPNSKGVPYVGLMGSNPITAADATTIYTFNFEVLENVSGMATFNLDTPEGIMIGSSYSLITTGYNQTGTSININSFTTKTTIVEAAEKFGVSVDVTDCPEAATLWVACYDGQTLVTCGSAPVAAGTSNVSFNIPAASYTKVKTFVWDANLKPLKGVEEN